MENQLFNGPRPPKYAKRVDVVRIKNTSPANFTILSPAIEVCHYHWISHRSQRCTGDHLTCPGCLEGAEQKWSGYLHAIRWQDNEAIFIELSPGLAEQIAAICAGRDTLRGSTLRIHRSKGGERGRYYVDLLERKMGAEEMPPAARPFDLLEKLWKAKRS